MEKKGLNSRPKIEIVRVTSIEQDSSRPFHGLQFHTGYSHLPTGSYCPEPEVKVAAVNVCGSKPPLEQTRKFKKSLGPVSRLLRRRHHSSYLATKSCDNIYSVNRNSQSLDWRVSQTVNEQGSHSRHSGSLDWRVGRSINLSCSKLHWRDTTRSAEQLSRSAAGPEQPQTPSTKSRLVSLLRRLSPRLSRPGSKASLQSSPTICPWVQVEFSSESIDGTGREESQESDVSFQRELQLSELRKRMAGIPTTSQVGLRPNSECKEQSKNSESRVRLQEGRTEHSSINKAVPYSPSTLHGLSLTVHEDRAEEDRRRSNEVAGLEEGDEVSSETLSASVPGVRPARRNRPLSLAVQPLNYRRLDPDPKLAPASHGFQGGRSIHHQPNMTSQESIGSCSLDVEQSASERSENTVDSVSKRTLHSLNLSCNGDSLSQPDNLTNGSTETLQKSHLTPDEKSTVSNGHSGSSPEPEQLTVKKPSYLGLSCSISGYSGITRYDSKLREGFRSRDSSPGTRLITRDPSPAGFRSNEKLHVPSHHYPSKSQSISPLAMDRQNGFTNGLKEECKVEAYRESRSSISICQGYSEVDKAVLHSPFPDMSPIRPSTPKRSPGLTQMMSCGQQNKSFPSHFSGSSPKQPASNLSATSFSDTSILNDSIVEVECHMSNTSTSSEKSFIQQRVERLYGPGALAQGFFFKRSTSKLNTSDSSFKKSNNNNDVSKDNANAEESLKNLPVLRHLRPEFRAQLPVVSPRRPTDGSEQVIKPLQRVSPMSRKVEQSPKPTASPSNSTDNSVVEISPVKLSASITSIPDQQPAAPKVVLPVLEPSASATNIAKQAQEAEKQAEEKDGHYFMKLLKQERDRLLSLAAATEAELASDSATLPEEAAGKLRSAAGKARLLATQKMQQFEGLCQKNIIQVPGEVFPTTCEDLAGFWDMVMLQVVQVNDLFEHLDKLRSSQWQETAVVTKPAPTTGQNGTTAKRRVAPVHKAKATANSEANKKAREAREQARRQLIEERRREMRAKAQDPENTVKIFAPET